MHSGELVDTIADYAAIVVLLVVPALLLYVFWMIHILPEKIAERRGHPQSDAIRTLCLLSLVFGGLLWPLAWLWAYTKPVLHKASYGTDRIDHQTDAAAPVEPGRVDALPAAAETPHVKRPAAAPRN
jgi:CBS domain containing-hemolysin-like protein